MAASLNINDIISQVKQLDKQEQLTLLQRVASLLKKQTVAEPTSVGLSALSGLGSDLWKSKDYIDQYIDDERQW